MIPFPVIVSGVLASRLLKRPFSEEDHPVEALILDRPDEPFRVGVQVGGPRGQANDLNAGVLEQIPERRRVLRVPIENEDMNRPGFVGGSIP